MVDHVDGLGPVLAAVADPTRRAIIDRLAQGPRRVTDLAAPFRMSLNAVSKHIKILEQAGLVRRTRHGREHTLHLSALPLAQVASWAQLYERHWRARLDALEAFFTRPPDEHP